MNSIQKEIPKCFHSEITHMTFFCLHHSSESVLFLLKDGTFYEYESFNLLRSIDLKDYLKGKGKISSLGFHNLILKIYNEIILFCDIF